MLIFALILASFVIFRAVTPMRIHWGWKAALALLTVVTACKFHLLYLLGGPMFFAPELPKWILLASSWIYAVLFIFFFLLAAAEIVRGIYLLVLLALKKKKTGRFRTAANITNLCLFAVAVLAASAGIAGGTSLPEVKKVSVKIAGLPTEAEGLSIAVIADIHADSLTDGAKVAKMAERANALKPDMIFILGDFVDGPVDMRSNDLAPLAGLSAKYGVFGVPGNHEYYSGYSEWMKHLRSLGINMLENSNAAIPCGGIVVAGVTDPVSGKFGEERPDVAKAFAGAGKDSVKILLSHRPSTAAEAARNGVALQISGHTHGGMILGVDRFVAAFNSGFVSGIYDAGGMTLYVSNGTGIWNGFPIRLGRPAEITLITLEK